MSLQNVLEILNDEAFDRFPHWHHESQIVKLMESILALSPNEAGELLRVVENTPQVPIFDYLQSDKFWRNGGEGSIAQKVQICKILWPNHNYAAVILAAFEKDIKTRSLPLLWLGGTHHTYDEWEKQEFEHSKRELLIAISALKSLGKKGIIDEEFLILLSDEHIDEAMSIEMLHEKFINMLASANDNDVIEHIVIAWSNLCPTNMAERKLRRLAIEGSNIEIRDKAKQALIILGGDEATFAATLDRQKALQSYKTLLEEMREETMKQWRNTEKRAQVSFWTTTVLNISTFAVGVGLIGFGLYLIATSTDPTQTISGAILSAVSTFATAISRGFLKEPLSRITRAPAEQGLTQGAFMAFMHQLAAIHLTFEARYVEGQIDLTELQKFQVMVREANKELSLHLRSVDLPVGVTRS